MILAITLTADPQTKAGKMSKASLPYGLELVADQPSLMPRGIVARGRALGIFAGAVTAAGLAGLAWGSIERQMPVLRRHEVNLSGTEGAAPLNVLHISDLHLYPGQDFIVDFLHRVAAEEHIDLVVSTGDNFGSADGFDLVMRAYEPLLHIPGAFVLGSNDYYSAQRKAWSSYLAGPSRKHEHQVPDLPWTRMVEAFIDAGWLDLSNRAGELRVPTRSGALRHVSFLGTDDAHIQRDRIADVLPSWKEADTVRIGVTHAPYRRVLEAFTDAHADIVFAGHTHGGQIGLPALGAIVTNCDIERRYAKGLHTWAGLRDETLLNVSAGLGTSPYAPIRIATRPEATLLTIR